MIDHPLVEGANVRTQSESMLGHKICNSIKKASFNSMHTIAAIAGNVQQSLRSFGNHSSAIVVKWYDRYDR